MKKAISLGLAISMMSLLSFSALAQSPENLSPETPSFYLSYGESDRTISSGSSWTSYQYYCAAGDYFSGYSEPYDGNGPLKITVYYSSSVGGSRSSVASSTVYSDGGEAFLRVSKSGYYNAVIKNNGSNTVVARCGISVN